LSFVSGQWSVGAKHLEDKLSVIAKNSSPNASPVQWSVVKEKQRTTDNEQLTTDNEQLTTNN
jgi:ATP-dependent DNA helicase RecQ